MKRQSCSECGAELRLRPTRCPLCGAEPEARAAGERGRPVDLDDYQRSVRMLREQLRRLRDDDAEAV